MKKGQRKALLWTTAYAELLTRGKVGGIGVQMMFWAKALKNNGWQVYSLYEKTDPEKTDDCIFLKDKETHSSTFLLYLFFAFKLLLKVRPELVLCRGGRNRNLFFIALWCRILGIKLVQLFGSDADMQNDIKDLQKNVRLNIKLFRWGLKLTKYFVAQNKKQQKQLNQQFKNKQLIIIPNIWDSSTKNKTPKKDLILWVGNTRKLKRPQWVFDIAEKFPHERFIIIGGNADNEVYNECANKAAESCNVDFLGALPFWETNEYFSNAKVLLCTSEYEGFPNTFLQAWANGVPVLSTVDPSDVIKKENLGKVCENQEDFILKLREMLMKSEYTVICGNINRYFTKAHGLQRNYEKLMDFLSL